MVIFNMKVYLAGMSMNFTCLNYDGCYDLYTMTYNVTFWFLFQLHTPYR